MDGYLGEVRMFAGAYIPENWAECNGQIMSIVDNSSLFSVLGTAYGGDGRSNFALPDLRSRAPIHIGQGPGLQYYRLGHRGGSDTITLTEANLPSHSHTLRASSDLGSSSSPDGALPATGTGSVPYATSATTSMSGEAITATGQGQPIHHMQPYLAIRFIICTMGLYPAKGQ